MTQWLDTNEPIIRLLPTYSQSTERILFPSHDKAGKV